MFICFTLFHLCFWSSLIISSLVLVYPLIVISRLPLLVQNRFFLLLFISRLALVILIVIVIMQDIIMTYFLLCTGRMQSILSTELTWRYRNTTLSPFLFFKRTLNFFLLLHYRLIEIFLHFFWEIKSTINFQLHVLKQHRDNDVNGIFCQ